ncbi:ATP-binding protein [Candidatus Poriferisodalis sp.]|uniref:ATP-binding protein n=1 Tax=Candidatus Poriferisodalis sp. TaxID=3101277 RepID=UPI003B5AB8BB
MEGYIPRILDTELDELLTGLPAISIEGPRAVGKTETATRRAKTVHRLDDARTTEIIRAEPERLTLGKPPILIDEWQRMPTSWDLVRRAVDRDRTPARFLLTGSAAPTAAPTHSGGGRIVTVRMRPMSLAERGISEPTVNISGLLSGQRPRLDGASQVRLGDYAAEIVNSGFPALRGNPERLCRAELDGYIHRIIDHDFDDLGLRIRDRGSLRRWMTAYAAATSTSASFATIRDAATPGEPDKPARSTTISYRAALEQLWMIEEIPAWLPTRNRLRRLAASPVHQLADPALAARLLGIGTEALLEGADGGRSIPRDGTLLGALFESLLTLSVRVYAQANEARVAHLRTRGGEREIDLILERADGRVAALEVKLSATVDDEDVRHLRWLADRLGPDLLDAAVITTGSEAYRRNDGIGVIPAALLTA